MRFVLPVSFSDFFNHWQTRSIFCRLAAANGSYKKWRRQTHWGHPQWNENSITYLRASVFLFSSLIASSSGSLIPRLEHMDSQLVNALAISAKWMSLIFWSNFSWPCGGMVISIWSREAFCIASMFKQSELESICQAKSRNEPRPYALSPYVFLLKFEAHSWSTNS